MEEKGKMLRLASQVSKWEITILTEGAESERRQSELKKETQDINRSFSNR